MKSLGRRIARGLVLAVAAGLFLPSAARAARPLFYVFAAEGRDFAYFRDLAEGHFGEENAVGTDGRRDADTLGAALLRVAVASPAALMDVLARGLAPSEDFDGDSGETGRLRGTDELVPTGRTVAGFMLVSHAASDAAFIGGKRLEAAAFVADRQKASPGSGFAPRLVENARITFWGCNSGNCHCDDELPSLAHALAALYADRRATLRGKTGTGDVNARFFATFRADRHGVAHRIGPDKDDYDFFFESPTKAYVEVRKIFADGADRDDALAFYARQGIVPLLRDDHEALVAVPTVTRVTRNSEKDAVLVAALRAIAAGGDALAAARRHLPGLERLFADTRLAALVRDVMKRHGGRLDTNDFRLWFRVYYSDFSFDRDCHRIVLQACPCDDDALQEKLLPPPPPPLDELLPVPSRFARSMR